MLLLVFCLKINLFFTTGSAQKQIYLKGINCHAVCGSEFLKGNRKWLRSTQSLRLRAMCFLVSTLSGSLLVSGEVERDCLHDRCCLKQVFKLGFLLFILLSVNFHMFAKGQNTIHFLKNNNNNKQTKRLNTLVKK